MPLTIGGHVSLNGKPRATVRQLAEDGFGCLQIFASSPGSWKPPAVDTVIAQDFSLAREEFGVRPLVIHAIYLINLASADSTLATRSRSSLKATLGAGAKLGAAAVVTHIGSHAGRGFGAVAEQIAQGLVEILESAPEGVDLLLENSAGAGAIVGSELGELGDLIRRAGSPSRLGVAVDTAHLCGAGWDFREEESAPRLVEEIDRDIGLERLRVVHANDSKQPCGSRKDRHANIGDGAIGLEGFRHLVRQPALLHVPWILETPNLERRIEDLAALQGLAVEPEAIGAARGA